MSQARVIERYQKSIKIYNGHKASVSVIFLQIKIFL